MAALIASIVMAGLQVGKSVYDQAKGASIRKNNPRPDYNIPFTSYENRSISGNRASRGLPQSTLDTFYNQQGQNQAASINAILAMGGTPNDVNMVFGNTMNNNRQILGEDALAKDRNIDSFMNINNQFGEQLDKRWQINQYAPYADKAQLASAYLTSANQGFGAAADTISTGFAANETQKLADAYLDMMNGKPPPQEKKIDPNADPYSFNWNDPALYGTGNDYSTPSDPPGYEDYNQFTF